MENLKPALKVFVKIIAVTIFCFFVVVSLLVMCNGLGTEKIGYTAYGVTEENDEFKELYTHYYADGVDELENEYTDKGYALQKVTIRSEFKGGPKTLFLTLSQIINIIILVGFLYTDLWNLGAADNNLANFGHKKADKFRGLKIGLYASVPNFIFFVIVFLFRNSFMSGFNAQMYKFAISYFYSFAELVLDGATVTADLSILKILILFALLFVIPAIAELSYLLGLKGISLEEKFVYKKEKK